MKNDKSQFVVRTSDFYLSLVIGHLPFDPRLVAKDFSSRNLGALGALRGFAVNPGLDFHREGAKHAKKTRRILVWLRLCCSVTLCLCGEKGTMKEPVVISWSGGKDSAMALYEVQRSGAYDVLALLTTVTADYDRVSMHGVRRELVQRQA